MISSRGGKKRWCVAEIDDEYIERMEDVLATYELPLCYKEPGVCLDEKSIQLLKNINATSRLARLRKPRQNDYEYERKGTANAFCVVEPKRGRYMVKITKKRKVGQFAEMMRDIGKAYPAASKIHLVIDNLSTHKRKFLIEHLGPRRGGNLWDRFTIHYTPKHGSWLNQAEIAISLFSRGCLGKDRIATRVTLAKRAAAWTQRVNEERRAINWRFTRGKARAKFRYSPGKFRDGQH
jgi:hypothetical protein